jgi:hypothetical protein
MGTPAAGAYSAAGAATTGAALGATWQTACRQQHQQWQQLACLTQRVTGEKKEDHLRHCDWYPTPQTAWQYGTVHGVASHHTMHTVLGTNARPLWRKAPFC